MKSAETKTGNPRLNIALQILAAAGPILLDWWLNRPRPDPSGAKGRR